MMKKLSYVLLILLVAILLLGIYINFKLGSIKNYAAISNARSSTILYALKQNKIDAAKSILLTNLTQLIYEYDKSVYTKYRTVRSTLCKDIPKYHIQDIKEYFKDTTYATGKPLEYKRSVFKNLERINTELCLDYE